MALVVLALIVSLDGFMVGSVLGVRKVRVPLLSVCLISLTSALVMYLSMSVGDFIRELSATVWVESAGALLLVSLGLALLLRPKKGRTKNGSAPHTFVAVWHDPLLADQDRSGDISASEAIILGGVLALDSLGAGLGTGMAGIGPVTGAVYTGMGKFLLISLGIRCGVNLTHILSEKVLSVVPGVMLVLLGCWSMVM